MRLTTKITLIVVGVTLSTCAATAYLSYASQLRLAEEAENKELRNLATFIQNDLQAQSDKAAARASLICSLPSIQEAFRAGDRDQIARRLVPAFTIQRDKFGVQEGQFHLSPATSFLRLFDLKNFGEDLSGFREMVLAANRRQEPQKGVEIGRQGLSIRGIDIVKDTQGPIGSFEIGMSFSTLLSDIKSNTGFEAGTFVEDQLMSMTATSVPRPDNEHIVGQYQNVAATNWQTIRRMVSADELEKVNDVALRHKKFSGADYGMVITPLLDFKGKQIGAIVAVGSFEAIHNRLLSALTEIVSISIFQAVVLIGMILLIIRAMFLRPMAQLRARIGELADGRQPDSASGLTRRRDEIGEAARQLEELQGSMASAQMLNTAAGKEVPPRA